MASGAWLPASNLRVACDELISHIHEKRKENEAKFLSQEVVVEWKFKASFPFLERTKRRPVDGLEWRIAVGDDYGFRWHYKVEGLYEEQEDLAKRLLEIALVGDPVYVTATDFEYIRDWYTA